MKILHTEASCGWGGQEIRILEESRGLMDRGHQVTIACPPQARLMKESARYGVPVVPLPIEFKTVSGFQALRRFLGARAFDVVNCHSSADSWLVALACTTMASPPAIVRTRHISAPIAPNVFNRWLYRRAASIVTTGESLRRHVIEVLDLSPSRVASIPTGVDIHRFSPAIDKASAKKAIGLDPTEQHIGIVATLRSWKGHLYLLEAFARLTRSGLRLVIVGEGPMHEPIMEKIGALGLGDRVILAGQRTDPERWMQALDVFCLPSYANEGVPQAIIQAMLCGLPIVTTPVGAICEAVDQDVTALVVPPKDVAALSEALGALLADKPRAAELGSAARRIASTNFSRDSMLTRMESIFLATGRA